MLCEVIFLNSALAVCNRMWLFIKLHYVHSNLGADEIFLPLLIIVMVITEFWDLIASHGSVLWVHAQVIQTVDLLCPQLMVLSQESSRYVITAFSLLHILFVLDKLHIWLLFCFFITFNSGEISTKKNSKQNKKKKTSLQRKMCQNCIAQLVRNMKMLSENAWGQISNAAIIRRFPFLR